MKCFQRGTVYLMNRNLKVEIFHSFEEENEAENRRRSQMSIEDRLKEFAILQERRWGSDWATKPIEKVVSYEKTDW
ncbi:MAG: hypothetical protein KAR40_13265 [Candidatus Sabulitectum sp.]|nr:hypothetical protein [Candidatus Sabulitectum sp.]